MLRDNTDRKARVLIVDDNEESIELLKYFLGSTGYIITTAVDGQQALNAAVVDRPDIILLDIVLPVLDGYQVCERLKNDSRTFHIPIIMITALRDLKDKIRALDAGADDFISKPFDNIELVARVKSLLRIKYFHDELIKRNLRLERQKKALEQEDRLKQELTDLIVHDMKNPLSVIQGNLRMMHMLKESGQIEDEGKYTRRIERSSQGLLRLILNLLDISRLEQKSLSLRPVPLRLNDLLEKSVDYFEEIPDHETKEVVQHLASDLPQVYFDYAFLERILDNLLHFALSNTRRHSTLTVETCCEETNFVTFCLKTEGQLLPKEFQYTIFSKAGQAEIKDHKMKPARRLSLIFCHLAIEANCGTIEFDTTYEDGMLMIVRLPIWEKERPRDRAISSPTETVIP